MTPYVLLSAETRRAINALVAESCHDPETLDAVRVTLDEVGPDENNLCKIIRCLELRGEVADGLAVKLLTIMRTPGLDSGRKVDWRRELRRHRPKGKRTCKKT